MHNNGSGNSRIALLLTLMTAMLGIQFVAGIYVSSFYISEGSSFSEVLLQSASFPILTLHIVLGAATFMVSLYAFVIGAASRQKYILLVLLGLNSLCILGAGISGVFYLSTKSAVYTFGMAMFWLLAFGFIGFSQTLLRSSSKAKS